MRKNKTKLPEGSPVTILELDRFLRPVPRAAAFGGAAAFFLLTAVLSQDSAVFRAVCAALAVVCAALSAAGVRRFSRRMPPELTVYEDAATYALYLQNSWQFRRSPRFYIALGIILCNLALLIAAPQFVLDFRIAFVAGAAFGLALAVFMALRWFAAAPLREVRLTEAKPERPLPKQHSYDRKRELKRALLLTAVFWIPVIIIYIALCIAFQSFNIFLHIPLTAGIVFLLFCLVSNPFSPYAELRSRRIFVWVLRVIVLAALSGGIALTLSSNSWNIYDEIYRFEPLDKEPVSISYSEDDGVFTVVRPAGRELRILQLTDIHIGGGITTKRQDKQALYDCELLIRKSQPDLVIITGDLVYPIPIETLSRNNGVPLYEFACFMEHLGVPWAFVYGNHDTEDAAIYSSYSMNSIMSVFAYGSQPDADGSKRLLFASTQPEISGRYNQYIRVENEARELERVLFLLDSNSYADGDLDYIHDDQVDWYAETVAALSQGRDTPVPSLLFCHIPLREYQDAFAALQNCEEDAEYLFGNNYEALNCPEERGRLFDTIRALGSTEAVFCGHDHYNNMGIRYKGIDLVYGMSIDYIAYPGIQTEIKQRGGTLICLTEDGSYTVEQLPLYKYTGI